MAQSVKVTVKHRKGVIGDMRHPITIIYPSVVYPEMVNQVDYTVYKNQEIVVFGSIETKGNVFVFDGANTGGVATDVFGIRYRKEVTTEFKLRVYGTIYQVIDVEDYENRKEFLRLKCREIGREADVIGKAAIIPEQLNENSSI